MAKKKKAAHRRRRKKPAPVQPGIEQLCLQDLKPADYNPRVISDEALAGLARSMERFGCVEPIVVNIRGGKNVIVGGHQRHKALMAAGATVCTCVTVDLSPADEKILNLALNNPRTQGEFIAELGDYIDELRSKIGGDDYLALRIEELRREYPEVEKEGLVPEDDLPEPPKKAKTKPGDLWLLGKHRLLCGSSTDAGDVKRLMGTNKASLLATDPPYCVDYTGNDRPGTGKDWSETFREKEIPSLTALLVPFYKIALKYIRPKTALYLWHASKKRGEIDDICKELGILVHQQIVWVKPCTVLSYSYYCWRHEPLLLMWKKGSMPKFDAKSKAIGTVWPLGYIKSGDPSTPEYYSDVWELDFEGKKRRPLDIEHPTVKPVEGFAIPIRVHTRPGDICYEPFCGSGTQLIAAEKLDRRCYAMEQEPIFCDVAIKRWEGYTGHTAKLSARAGNGPKKRRSADKRPPGRRRGRTGAGR